MAPKVEEPTPEAPKEEAKVEETPAPAAAEEPVAAAPAAETTDAAAPATTEEPAKEVAKDEAKDDEAKPLLKLLSLRPLWLRPPRLRRHLLPPRSLPKKLRPLLLLSLLLRLLPLLKSPKKKRRRRKRRRDLLKPPKLAAVFPLVSVTSSSPSPKLRFPHLPRSTSTHQRLTSLLPLLLSRTLHQRLLPKRRPLLRSRPRSLLPTSPQKHLKLHLLSPLLHKCLLACLLVFNDRYEFYPIYRFVLIFTILLPSSTSITSLGLRLVYSSTCVFSFLSFVPYTWIWWSRSFYSVMTSFYDKPHPTRLIHSIPWSDYIPLLSLSDHDFMPLGFLL
ncbi:hypothetical protein BT96DRAFT_694365 [Gymnopus androsaceus JB14]|uniref:Uncharacterized protein n=1 Tax=Gymnopus androsaceus JB14 TaxID=1447944 RepID=A0A6A4HLG8_9AGAR|nr:hypothetical protein BT96DRAFT_694365 [Gymnopus androsaceus JB14]